mgnify:CR=1 FL=1
MHLAKDHYLTRIFFLTLFLISIVFYAYFSLTTKSSNAEQEKAVKTQEVEPVPKSTTVTGAVKYSFISSILSSGLSNSELKSLLSLLGDNFDIIKSVNNGDKFSIKTQHDTTDTEFVSAFYYMGSDIDFFAMRGTDDNIYIENGYRLNNRYSFPLPKHFRVSSSFDLNRKHPITNRILPHFGTDYATPVGTEVLSLSDGIVMKSLYNRFAGNYLTIKHTDGNYARYLHLSQIDVNIGERVTKGQIIGLTGNSGRTTGPHLHLELSVAGAPVDFEKYIKAEKSYNEQFVYIAQAERKQLIKSLTKTLPLNQPST